MTLDNVLAIANTYDIPVAKESLMGTTLLELCIDGLDTESDDQMELMADNFADLSLASIDGQLMVGIYGDFDPVKEAERTALELYKVLPHIRVTRWYEDFVSYSEIAHRTGVSREAVRLWATGQRGPQDFPTPIGSVGSGERRSPIWTWSVVSEWLAENDIFEDTYVYPSQRQVVEINWALAKLLDTAQASA